MSISFNSLNADAGTGHLSLWTCVDLASSSTNNINSIHFFLFFFQNLRSIKRCSLAHQELTGTRR